MSTDQRIKKTPFIVCQEMKKPRSFRLVFVLMEFCFYEISDSGLAPTWNSCGCYWGSWEAWSACTRTCGGGRRYRDRLVWHKDVPECDGFECCTSNDRGYEYIACNTVCQNGGSFSYTTGMIQYSNYGKCICTSGQYGTCCEQSMQ